MTTKTKERPILFNDEMVRAILEGRKNQTRRPVKPQPIYHSDKTPTSISQYWTWKDERLCDLKLDGFLKYSPFGQPGDLLWVRECFYCDHVGFPKAPIDEMRELLYYRTSDLAPSGNTYTGISGETMRNPWTPSIHMPRWASRLTLRVKRVWVERVQSISSQDAWDEGCRCNCTKPVPLCAGNIEAFRADWNANHESKGQGWDANPFVWCCEFEVAKGEKRD